MRDIRATIITIRRAGERSVVFRHGLNLDDPCGFRVIGVEFAPCFGERWAEARGVEIKGIDANKARAEFDALAVLAPGMRFRVSLQSLAGSEFETVRRAKFERRVFGAPAEAYQNAFFALNAREFENAPNFRRDILRETAYGSGEFADCKCRVDSVVSDGASGVNRGADYRKFIFEPYARRVCVGEMFMWVGSYWICVNTDAYGTLTNSGTMRRCDVMLRFLDDGGNLREVPAAFDADERQGSDADKRFLTEASGFLRATVRKDSISNLIKSDKRFLLGTPDNRMCVKTTGGGVFNAVDAQTDGYSGRGLIRLWLKIDAVNRERDDLENGIADAYAGGRGSGGGGAWSAERDA